jgi:hypothetical protein
MIKARTYGLPQDLQSKIESLLKQDYGLSFSDSRALAKHIERLSDHYIDQPETPTPWHEDWCQIAYLAYYFPLNWLRAQAVIAEGRKFSFFKDFRQMIDYGSGLGSMSLSLAEIPQKTYIETSATAEKLHAQLGGQGLWLNSPNEIKPGTLAAFGYSLTESDKIPSWLENCEGLMIVEPSTRQRGRRLQELREQFLKKGFFAWAPCTHQKNCPLLHQNKNDWCHDRIHFEQPDWFAALETLLPMKNKTLTFSYLLLRKQAPKELAYAARTVGDQLKEKGKYRQMVCRDEKREFLAWMLKETEPQEIPRGTLIKWPDEFSEKSNEIRIKTELNEY